MDVYEEIARRMYKDIARIRSKFLKAQQEDIEIDELLGEVNCDALHGRVVGRQEVIDSLTEFLSKYGRRSEGSEFDVIEPDRSCKDDSGVQ